MNLFFVFLTLALFSSAESICEKKESDAISKAFKSVEGFNISLIDGATSPNCTMEISITSKSLNGTVSWKSLEKLTKLKKLDLSGNFLNGSIYDIFSSIPSLEEIDLSGNQFHGSLRKSSTSLPALSLKVLKLSRNRFTNIKLTGDFNNTSHLDVSDNNLQKLPVGLGNLSKLENLNLSGCNISDVVDSISNLPLKVLDLSNNFLKGNFDSDFPDISKLTFLNISSNKFTGQYNGPKFNKSCFIDSGVQYISSGNPNINKSPLPLPTSPSSSPTFEVNTYKEIKPREKPNSKKKILIISLILIFIIASALIIWLVCIRRIKRFYGRKCIKQLTSLHGILIEKSGPFSFETENRRTWVADIKDPATVTATIFEKPLMNLTFSDLIVATSYFGKESQLSEGRGGPVYRAILPGDFHVAIKVLEQMKAVDSTEAVQKFEALSKMNHPNLLPLLGYCIVGQEKLVLYEYMTNGDLHQWLHELPAGGCNVEDWSTDTWEQQNGSLKIAGDRMNWPTRHRIAVGISRGLAFLHHVSAVHGHLVTTNILLDDNLEPKIADFGIESGGDYSGGIEQDVYAFGVILMELLTGKVVSPETVARVRELVKHNHGINALDPSLISGDGSVVEMVESLKVGYLCTAELPEKRPTMLQVVGLLKDIRPENT